MDDDLETTSPSLLNTENGDLDPQAHGYTDSGNEESDYSLTCSQQPSQAKKIEENKKAMNRKASKDVPITTEAKIKTEGSIKKLNEHFKNTCPKPLRNSARANIPADKQ